MKTIIKKQVLQFVGGASLVIGALFILINLTGYPIIRIASIIDKEFFTDEYTQSKSVQEYKDTYNEINMIIEMLEEAQYKIQIDLEITENIAKSNAMNKAFKEPIPETEEEEEEEFEPFEAEIIEALNEIDSNYDKEEGAITDPAILGSREFLHRNNI